MAVNEDYLIYIQDQLSDLGDFETKKMFGGVGFFKDGVMFGMIGYGVFRLKTDDTNRQDYVSRGMEAFSSSSKKKGMPYYAVPEEVLNDKSELKTWALKSYEIALRNKK